MKPFALLAAGLPLLLAPSLSPADVWDEGSDADNTCLSTDNELVHGVQQVHDLGALPGPTVDQDFYAFSGHAYSSYEAVIDGTTGDLDNEGVSDFAFERLDDFCGPLQGFTPISGFGFSRSIRWETGGAGGITFLRVGSAGCGTACTAADQYRIRFYETTYTIPRFNNSVTQVTVLIIQNPATYPISGSARFYNSAGTQLAALPFSLAAFASSTVTTTSNPALVGQSGSIVISHNGRYGDLAGKAVALEPATGFSFDSPMTPRPY